MELCLDMGSPLYGLNWDDATTWANVEPTPASMDAGFTPSPTKNQPSTSPSAGRNDKLTTSIGKFQVCSTCRRKKRKCSLDRPSCSLCLENGWTCEYRCMKKKPGPAKRLSSAPVLAPPAVAIVPENISSTSSSAFPTLPTISDYAKSKLTELYFTHIQPIFPVFCRKSFERDLAEGKIPNKLLYAFYAVSSRRVPPEEVQTLFGYASDTPWENFAQIAERESREQEAKNTHISLNDVKADVLLTLYEFTSFPGRKAWIMAGTLVRMALAIGLHRVDCGIQNTNLTDFELEERRFVWWAVWKLDSAINTLTGTPFGIDSQSIGTSLVSTSIADFTAGNTVKAKLQFLPTYSSRSWRSAQEQLTTDTEDGMNMYLLAVCHLRTVTLCRQRLHANITPELVRHSLVLRNTLPCMRLSLPEWYFDPSIHYATENTRSHRARLETLLIIHISQIQCFLPFSVASIDDLIADDTISNWKMSVASGQDIAAIFRHWKPEYFVIADPFVGATLWFTISMLTLHTMSVYGRSEEGPDVRISNALDLLHLALQNFARHWQFAQLLLGMQTQSLLPNAPTWYSTNIREDSVNRLQGWTWLKLDFSEILSLLAQLRIPMNPLNQKPGSIDMWQILGNIDDVTVEQLSTVQNLE